MESLLSDMWELQPKHSSAEVLQRWRDLCGVLVKNRRRRFRFSADLSKRHEAAEMRKTNQEKLTISVQVSKAALDFIKGEKSSDYTDSETEAISRKQGIHEIEKSKESEGRSFMVFVWEALHNISLVTPVICALVSLVAGILTEGWPKGARQGIGIVACVLLVVYVTAKRDYRRQFSKEKDEVVRGNGDETPRVTMRGVATTIIGKIGLAFAVVSVEVLVQKLIGWKWQAGSTLVWVGYDALELLECFAMAAVPEGLPLAVALIIVFAMKKMTDNALFRRLAAGET